MGAVSQFVPWSPARFPWANPSRKPAWAGSEYFTNYSELCCACLKTMAACYPNPRIRPPEPVSFGRSGRDLCDCKLVQPQFF